jgi:hypothetical protein
MTRNLAKNAKRKALFTEFCTHGQTKMETSENGTHPQTLLFSDDAIKSRPWILQIVSSAITGLPTQPMFS